jgi:amidase
MRWMLLLSALCLPGVVFAQDNLSGRWTVSSDYLGTRVYTPLNLKQQGDKLTGDFDGDPLEGTVHGSTVQFLAKDAQGGTEECNATLSKGTLRGSLVFREMEAGHPTSAVTAAFTATLAPQRRTGAPQRHDFKPESFSRQFSALNKPVLTVWPGDSIHTTTVDAAGTDENSVSRVFGGNPETGPFYVETAVPGDTLVVTIKRLRLNRDWALSTDGVVERGLTNDLAVTMKDGFKPVRWNLDLQRGLATPEKPGEHLKGYSVPVRPMLGCVATAPSPIQAAPGTGDSGRWGGNMDFNEIVEGATVYLPVNVPGALLYFGDGHALQGDGELNGDALETSMEVEVTVDVISGQHPPGPRVESATYFMAMGLDGSLDGAFRSATENMASWLSDTYQLTPSETAQVLGTLAEYKVSEVADRNAGVVVKLRKDRLTGLKAMKASPDAGAGRSLSGG